MEKYTVTYQGKKTEVTGRSCEGLDGAPDFCCETVQINGRIVTHELYTPDFTRIEKLVLTEKK